jgi:hypothetical protein
MRNYFDKEFDEKTGSNILLSIDNLTKSGTNLDSSIVSADVYPKTLKALECE